MSRRYLSPEQARRFYDRMGAKQDSQAFYEDPALDVLVEQGRFRDAESVLEIGCGTGRLGCRLVDDEMAGTARYCGLDLSITMASLARHCLEARGGRSLVLRARAGDGLPFVEGAFDRVLSTYVLDLLPPDKAESSLAEAHRVLRPGGLLCLAGITPGAAGLSRWTMALWSRIHRLSPALVGGCRPIRAADLLPGENWTMLHHEVVVSFGVASEVLVAAKAAEVHKPPSRNRALSGAWATVPTLAQRRDAPTTRRP